MSVATIYNFIRRATCACVRPLSFEAARYHAEGPELFLKTHIGSNSPVSVDMQPSFNGKLFNLLIFPMYIKYGLWLLIRVIDYWHQEGARER
jgi:hypothetical protein